MWYVGYLGALSLACLCSAQGVMAQAGPCAGQPCPGSVALAPVGQAPAGKMPGQAERCPGLPIEVEAGSAEERSLACSAGASALQLLGRCDIAPKRAVRVKIMSEVRHPLRGPIFGMFDLAREQVLITGEANMAALVAETPYASLPLRDFYRSLIVHEVVHGVMHQNLTRKATTHAACEYPAYALQLESLPADVREAFLRSFDQAALTSDAPFTDTVLFFDPYAFAARAYHHFKRSPDACAHLVGLLSGEVAFIAPPM